MTAGALFVYGTCSRGGRLVPPEKKQESKELPAWFDPSLKMETLVQRLRTVLLKLVSYHLVQPHPQYRTAIKLLTQEVKRNRDPHINDALARLHLQVQVQD